MAKRLNETERKIWMKADAIKSESQQKAAANSGSTTKIDLMNRDYWFYKGKCEAALEIMVFLKDGE